MTPRPTSDELWGQHSMPSPCEFEILMPNSLLLALELNRELGLGEVKERLWVKAKNEVLFRLLNEPQSYIFVGVTVDGKVEEFYDEARRLCDLRLFQPFLKLVEPQGDKEEKKLNSLISAVIGKAVNEFDSNKDLEFVECRHSFMSMAQTVVTERQSFTLNRKFTYHFPTEVEVRHSAYHCNELSRTIKIRFFPPDETAKAIEEEICLQLKPLDVIELLRSKYSLTVEEIVIKVCAFDDYLFGDFHLHEFKYIGRCISQKRIPELCLKLKNDLLTLIPNEAFIIPSSLRRSVDTASRAKIEQEDIEHKKLTSLWQVSEYFKVHINLVTYANVKDTYQIFVKAAIFHGDEMLSKEMCTLGVVPQNPKWLEGLEFNVLVEDIPRSARLCLGLFAVHRKKQEPTLEAWCNQPLFNYRNQLLTGKLNLPLWRATKDNMGQLHHLGTTGPNPDKDATCLEIEFSHFKTPVIFPPDFFVKLYADHLFKTNLNAEAKGKGSPKHGLNDEELKAKYEELVKPFSELTEQDKEIVRNSKDYCRNNYPDALPLLLESVIWKCREEVALLYSLLLNWNPIKIETALELLDCRFPDPKVRQLAIATLDARLSDAQLAEYLLQLVHVSLNEPYLDNIVSTFLLKRALLNRAIGHYFFWLLKAEIHDIPHSVRCALLLEAYCRGIDSLQLISLDRQVDGLKKLNLLTNILKDRKNATQKDRLALLRATIRQEDYVQALNNLQCPLKYSVKLGKLQIDKCRIMDSAKRPLWLVWENGDETSKMLEHNHNHEIIFKDGDDLRQDMLTLQVIRIMDSIWRSEGLDLMMLPYNCLATGFQVGLIEVVRDSKTISHLQSNFGLMATIQLASKELHRHFERLYKHSNSAKYNQIIDTFTKSCAGYCVATYVLGIGDRNPDNIMVNGDGQIFHIDFGHFLGHFKKKFGISRERVPFVLTQDFLLVICRGEEVSDDNKHYIEFTKLCLEAYSILRKHASLLITLFTMMLSTGIPELQSPEDVDYIKTTLQVELSEEMAIENFKARLSEARGLSRYTKMDWFFHNVAHS